MTLRLSCLALLAALATPASLRADIVPAPLFRDGAVLQRGKPVPVWGTAAAGEKVAVSFGGNTVSAVAGADGRWSVTLPALDVSATPRELTLKGKNTLVVRDVLVGEVWIASGQSNMEWPLDYAANGKAEAKASNLPQLRQFKVTKRSSFTPLSTAEGTWESATAATAGQFSAVAYYFGRELHTELKVPVGILNSSWGGTGIDAWIDADTYRTVPELAKRFAGQEKAVRATPEQISAHESAVTEWKKKQAAARTAKQPFTDPEPKAPAGIPGPRTAAGLNRAMIAPLAPYAFRGAIWYQGESNTSQASGYTLRMSALVTGWRKQFGQGDFPFYWVQLPNFDHGNRNADTWHWAQLREAQTKALALPNTGQAITIDVGEPKGLHPAAKKPVGERLALLALARAYKTKNVIDSGPVIAAATREGASYRVTFAPLASPLQAAPAGLTGFELAGADKVFHEATARIDGDAIVVTSPKVPAPAALRYAYRNAPVAGLFNAAGLPAAPFRTDDW